MPKGPCDKRKRTKDPKCTDKPECDWYPGKGCYPKGTTFEDKPKKKSTSKSSSKTASKSSEEQLRARLEVLQQPQSSPSVDDAAAILSGLKQDSIKELKEEYSDFATVFIVALPDGKFKYPPFPKETIFVENKEGELDECYYPEWIYKKNTKTNHIKCKSEEEYRKLFSHYYQQRDAAEKVWSRQKNQSILEDIIANGGKLGDLVVDINNYNYGYRSGGVNVLLYDNETGQLEISPLGMEVDDYGNIPSSLSLSKSFKPGYWTYALDNGEHIDLANPDDPLFQSEAYWHGSEEQFEPLHRTYLKGLRKNQIKQDANGYLFIDLKFMKLKYAGSMSRDELHSALRARNIEDAFVASGETLYVRPDMDEPGTSYIVGRDD